MSADCVETETAASEATPSRRRRRSFFPRFGLRTLLIFAILFCLAFGWIGRRYYRLRQDEAAIEALQRAGPGIVLGSEPLHWEVETPLVAFDNSGAVWERARIVLGLSGRPRLKSAWLYIDDPDDERLRPALEALKRFPEIEAVSLSGSGFDEDAIQALADLPSLVDLCLRETRVTGAGLAPLAGSTNLRQIYVMCESPPGDLAVGVASLKSLRIVGLSGDARLDRAEVATLASLPELEELFLWDTMPSGEVDMLSPLESAASLKALRLDSLRPDGAIGEPPHLPKLQLLTLYGINDETLAKWPTSATLRQAEFGLPVTPKACAAFSAANPDCEVEYFPFNGPMFVYRRGKVFE